MPPKVRLSSGTRLLVGPMVRGGLGPLSSVLVLLALPLASASFMREQDFAVWAIFNTVVTLATTIDFGGAAYVMAALPSAKSPASVIYRSARHSAYGSLTVGAIAAAVWPLYVMSGGAGAWGVAEGLAAIAAITVAAALRSLIIVVANAALVVRKNALRDTLLIGHSVAVCGIGVGLAAYFASAWALPTAWLASMTVFSAVGFVAVRQIAAVHRFAPGGDDMEASSRGWASKRTATAVLRGLLMNADRWILGSVAGASVLATYEVIWRIASAPRVVATSITTALIGTSAAVKSNGHKALLGLLNKASNITAWAVAIGVIGSAIVYALSVHLGLAAGASATLWMVLVTASAADGLTSPLTTLSLGLGRPGFDLPYLSLTCGSAGLLWVLAIALAAPSLVAYGTSAVWIAGSALYVLRGPRRVTYS